MKGGRSPQSGSFVAGLEPKSEAPPTSALYLSTVGSCWLVVRGLWNGVLPGLSPVGFTVTGSLGLCLLLVQGIMPVLCRVLVGQLAWSLVLDHITSGF